MIFRRRASTIGCRRSTPTCSGEFAKGRGSRIALVVSPGGNPRVRAAAARWLAEAPAPDDVGEYHRSRQADPDAFSPASSRAGTS